MNINSENTRAPFMRMASVAVLAIVISGCGSPTDYTTTIGELKTAIDSTISTISTIDATITKRKNEIWQDEIVAGTALLENKDESCAIGESGCSLLVRHSGEEGIDFPLKSVLVKSQAGLTALKSYVANLKAIVEADTAGQITEQTNKAIASLTEIEAEVAKANGTDPSKGLIAAYSEPIGAFFKWAVERYVDHVKLDALATATKRAHPAILGLNDLMSTIENSAVTVAFSEAQKVFLAEKVKFDAADTSTSITQAIISDYVNAVVAVDQALKASAAEPLAAFTTAHEKLMMNLNNEGDISLADAIAAIDDLKMRATEFKALVEGFTNVGN